MKSGNETHNKPRRITREFQKSVSGKCFSLSPGERAEVRADVEHLL
jgi:hypothetical protein